MQMINREKTGWGSTKNEMDQEIKREKNKQ